MTSLGAHNQTRGAYLAAELIAIKDHEQCSHVASG